MKKMLNKNILILPAVLALLFMAKLSYAQTWAQTQNQIKENTQQIENINERIADLKDNYRLLYDGAKNQNDQLGHLISYSSFIFAILGIILAWYINRQYEKIKEMKDVIDITKKAVDDHATDLYKKLKREETLGLLERIAEVPEDITNIAPLLLSRDLLRDDFLYLKEPYLKIKNNLPLDLMAKGNYITLLMQHFPYESLKDQDVKDEIVSGISPLNLNNMFPRDIKNFFDQVLKYLKEFKVDNEQNKTIIKMLFYFYSKSKFQSDIELQNYIKVTLVKYKMKTNDISSILKEHAPTDTIYTAWIDSIFT